jgi:phosphoglycolate phosphatase-like HAD superfamily hydrolase
MPESGLPTGCNVAAVKCMKGEAGKAGNTRSRVPLSRSFAALAARPQVHPERSMLKKPRQKSLEKRATENPAFLFDLDGTLMDTVYQHVLAWREALEIAGIELSVWRIHRRIGMSGGLFVNALLRETGHQLTKEEAIQLQRLHAKAYGRLVNQVRPLPGARELLAYLSDAKVPWAIATSGRMESAGPALKILGVDLKKTTVITRDLVQYAKPNPDLFIAAADKLGVHLGSSVVVGDSVWDLLAARRAAALGIGLLSGGYGRDELEKAGAYRVYHDPADMLEHLDEVGVRRAESV